MKICNLINWADSRNDDIDFYLISITQYAIIEQRRKTVMEISDVNGRRSVLHNA